MTGGRHDIEGISREAEIRRLDEVELRSVAKVALLFYVTAFGVLAAALAAVWLLTETLGLVGKFEDFMSSIGLRGFRIMSPVVVLGVFLLFGAMVVFLTVLTVLFAGFYNLAARHGLGVRLTVSPHRRPERLPAATSYDVDCEDRLGRRGTRESTRGSASRRRIRYRTARG